MLKMIECYHPDDGLPLFIMQKVEGQKGCIESDGLSEADFVQWPDSMVDTFLLIANELDIGETASYGLCVDDCIFCDVLRERLRQSKGG